MACAPENTNSDGPSLHIGACLVRTFQYCWSEPVSFYRTAASKLQPIAIAASAMVYHTNRCPNKPAFQGALACELPACTGHCTCGYSTQVTGYAGLQHNPVCVLNVCVGWGLLPLVMLWAAVRIRPSRYMPTASCLCHARALSTHTRAV